MTTITTRSGKGSPLTNNEVDANFTNLNDDKVEASGDSMTGDLSFGDNNKVILGSGNDLQLYHDGTDSIINEGTAGNLLVQGATIKLQTANGAKDYLVATPSAEITLYHNNPARLATTATGIDVSGTATMDGLTVDGSATITQSAGSDFLKFDVDGTTDEAILGIDSTDFIIDIDPTNVRASSNFVVKNDGTTNLTLNSSGNLDVNGTVTADGLTVDGATDGTAVALFRADNNGVTKKNTLRFEDTDTTTQNDQQIGRIEFYSNDTDHTGVDAVIEAVSATTGLKELRFLTSDTANTPLSRLAINKSGDISFYEDTGTTAKLFWDASAESLGIGNTSPIAALDVTGTDSTGSLTSLGDTVTRAAAVIRGSTHANGYGLYMGYGNSTTDGQYIQATRASGSTAFPLLLNPYGGNVGIGTDNPNELLHLSHTGGNAVLRFTRDDTTTTSGSSVGTIQFAHTDADNAGVAATIVGKATNAFGKVALLFATGSPTTKTERMRLDAEGNLLVGTTNTAPASSGNVAGSSLLAIGKAEHSRDGGVVLALNRKTSDGDIVDFRKDGTTVGSIGTEVADATTPAELVITAGSVNAARLWLKGGDSGLILDGHTNSVLPTDENSYEDNRTDLGSSSYRFKNLYVTGFRAATHKFENLAGSSEYGRFDSSGNLLVGTTSTTPAFSSTGSGIALKSSESAISADGALALVLNRNTSDGAIQQFRKGGSTVGSIASVGGSDIKVVFSSDGDQYITGNAASNYLTFSSANAERMRLDSSGNLLVGKTVTTYTTDGFRASNIGFGASRTSGTVADMNRNGTDGNVFAFYKAGTIVGSISVTSSATAYNTSSDQRLNDNIVDAPSASDDIDAIQVRSFDWKADGSHQKYGMVAQELQSVAPEAVSQGETEEDMMGVDYSKLVPMLVKEIQSLRARVAQLEGEN